MFHGRWCILTPGPDADAASLAKLEGGGFWRRLGSNVELMTPEHHDMVLAITSHVPHLIAYNIVNTAAHLEARDGQRSHQVFRCRLRDFTRIAASDPVMWRDVFLNNKEAVLEMLGRFSEDLVALQRAIRFGDGSTPRAPVHRSSARSGAVSSRPARIRHSRISAATPRERLKSRIEIGSFERLGRKRFV